MKGQFRRLSKPNKKLTLAAESDTPWATFINNPPTLPLFTSPSRPDDTSLISPMGLPRKSTEPTIAAAWLRISCWTVTRKTFELPPENQFHFKREDTLDVINSHRCAEGLTITEGKLFRILVRYLPVVFCPCFNARHDAKHKSTYIQKIHFHNTYVIFNITRAWVKEKSLGSRLESNTGRERETRGELSDIY